MEPVHVYSQNLVLKQLSLNKSCMDASSSFILCNRDQFNCNMNVANTTVSLIIVSCFCYMILTALLRTPELVQYNASSDSDGHRYLNVGNKAWIRQSSNSMKSLLQTPFVRKALVEELNYGQKTKDMPLFSVQVLCKWAEYSNSCWPTWKKRKKKRIVTGQVQDTSHAATGHKTSSLHDWDASCLLHSAALQQTDS